VDHVQLLVAHAEGGVYLHAAPLFHIRRLPFMFPRGLRHLSGHHAKFNPQAFLRDSPTGAGHAHRPGADDDQSPDSFEHLADYDLSSLVELGYADRLSHPSSSTGRAALPHVKLVQVYGLSETGFLTGLTRSRAHAEQALSCDDPVPESMCVS